MTTITKIKLIIKNKHIIKIIGSTINIKGRPEAIWDNITNVKSNSFLTQSFSNLLTYQNHLKRK